MQPEQNSTFKSRLKPILEFFGLHLGDEAPSCDDSAVPNIDPPATDIKQFQLGKDFQEEFDQWKAKVEKERNGTLEITHQEVLHQESTLLISWRIAPRPHMARGR